MNVFNIFFHICVIIYVIFESTVIVIVELIEEILT